MGDSTPNIDKQGSSDPRTAWVTELDLARSAMLFLGSGFVVFGFLAPSASRPSFPVIAALGIALLSAFAVSLRSPRLGLGLALAAVAIESTYRVVHTGWGGLSVNTEIAPRAATMLIVGNSLRDYLFRGAAVSKLPARWAIGVLVMLVGSALGFHSSQPSPLTLSRFHGTHFSIDLPQDRKIDTKEGNTPVGPTRFDSVVSSPPGVTLSVATFEVLDTRNCAGAPEPDCAKEAAGMIIQKVVTKPGARLVSRRSGEYEEFIVVFDDGFQTTMRLWAAANRAYVVSMTHGASAEPAADAVEAFNSFRLE